MAGDVESSSPRHDRSSRSALRYLAMGSTNSWFIKCSSVESMGLMVFLTLLSDTSIDSRLSGDPLEALSLSLPRHSSLFIDMKRLMCRRLVHSKQ